MDNISSLLCSDDLRKEEVEFIFNVQYTYFTKTD